MVLRATKYETSAEGGRRISSRSAVMITIIAGLRACSLLPVSRPKIIAIGTRIASAIDKRGEGIHHLTFAVTDLDAMLDRLQSVGVQILGGGARAGAEGMDARAAAVSEAPR